MAAHLRIPSARESVLDQARASALCIVRKEDIRPNNAANRVAQHDVGAASAQISLEATACGLHTHGVAGFDPEKLATSLGVPNDFEAVACWALGHRGNPETLNEQQKQMELSPRNRKALAEIVFGDWGSPAF